jgi:hypothetical protein
MSRHLRRLHVGLMATVAMALLAGMVAGRQAAVAAAAFGALAVALQLAAGEVARRQQQGADRDVMKEHLIGMAFRVAGVALIAVAVTTDRATFPPGACATGYLGTVLPLMWLETRLA